MRNVLGKGETQMEHRGLALIVPIVGSAALLVVAGGCATERTTSPSSLSDPAAAIPPTQLSGTWRGELWPVGTDSTSTLNSDVALEFKDDATYRLTSTRRGTVSNDSGNVVRDGGAVILRSSSGQSTRLLRNGDTLYGIVTTSGRPMNIMVKKVQ
jgi:hypothetical protein